ncbi:MAG: type IV pilus modification protein PilV [Proteobacteria bacterium]|nr:type IV pilus modification protein PilV [Pseudomonadota bacterium]
MSLVKPYTQGFSLMEALITLVVLSVGLLGVSAMVTNSVRFTDTAEMRSQSVMLAYDIADKMRANSDNTIDYTIDIGANVANSPDCSTNSCSGEDLADADLANWKARLANNLPAGDGSTVINADAASITIQWSDRGQLRTFNMVTAL